MDWSHGVGHSPVCQILLQIVMRAVITSCPPSWASCAGMLLTPADFPSLHLLAKDGVAVLYVCPGTVQYWWISLGLVIIQLRAVFCPLVLLFDCEAFSWTILDSSRFPLFHSGQVFHRLECPLTVVLPQIFFFLTSLHCSPIRFYLAFFMRLLMLLFTSLYVSDPSGSNLFFLSSLLLSNRSRISAVIQIMTMMA